MAYWQGLNDFRNERFEIISRSMNEKMENVEWNNNNNMNALDFKMRNEC